MAALFVGIRLAGILPLSLLVKRTVYQLWQDQITGEVYSVRLECYEDDQHPRITGVCRSTDPMSLPVDGAFRDDCYQAGTYLRDVEARRDEFTVLLRERQGRAV